MEVAMLDSYFPEIRWFSVLLDHLKFQPHPTTESKYLIKNIIQLIVIEIFKRKVIVGGEA